jgi:hypothetical protein
MASIPHIFRARKCSAVSAVPAGSSTDWLSVTTVRAASTPGLSLPQGTIMIFLHSYPEYATSWLKGRPDWT